MIGAAAILGRNLGHSGKEERVSASECGGGFFQSGDGVFGWVGAGTVVHLLVAGAREEGQEDFLDSGEFDGVWGQADSGGGGGAEAVGAERGGGWVAQG